MDTVAKLEKLASLQKEAASDWEKRTYTIEGRPEHLDKLEDMLNWMAWCGRVGHSTDFKVGFDGDGAARIKIKAKDGRKLHDIRDNPKTKIDEINGRPKDPESFDFE